VAKLSAGLLLHRNTSAGTEVLLVHPGGPLWAKRRGDGTWSIPKGEPVPQESGDPLAAAEREFAEELGVPAPPGARLPLGEVVQSGGKHVLAWAVEGDLDPGALSSNRFEMEWPPKSGTMREFPEVDRAQWMTISEANTRLVAAQVELLSRLTSELRLDTPAD